MAAGNYFVNGCTAANFTGRRIFQAGDFFKTEIPMGE